MDNWESVPNHEWYEIEDHGPGFAGPSPVSDDWAWDEFEQEMIRSDANIGTMSLKDIFMAGYERGCDDTSDMLREEYEGPVKFMEKIQK